MQYLLTQGSQSVNDNPFSDINSSRSESEGNDIHEDDTISCIESSSNTAPTIDGSSIEVVELKFSYGIEFSTIEEAESLYLNYARAKRFRVRKYLKRKNTDGKVKSRRWVCSKEGFRPQKYLLNHTRKRGPQPLTRTGYKAEFRVFFNPNKGCWFSTFFTAAHNHELTPPHHVHYICSHRRVSEPDMAAATAMHRVGIRLSHIHEYMVQRSGSYSHVGYLRKDL